MNLRSRSALTHRLSHRWHYCCLAVVTCAVALIFHLFAPSVLPASIEPVAAQEQDRQQEKYQQQNHSQEVGTLLRRAYQFNQQGQRLFGQGDIQGALDHWQKAEQHYRQARDQQGVWGSQLNQAKALQTLGFYHRSQSLLVQLNDRLATEPNSLLEVNVALTLGQGLRLQGKLDDSETVLRQALAIADQLQDVDHQQTAFLYLGNTLAAQQDWSTALQQYTAAANLDAPLQLTAQLRQIQILPALQREDEIASETQVLVQQLQKLARSSIEQPLADMTPVDMTPAHITLDLIQWLLQQSPETLLSVPELATGLMPQVIEQAQRQGDRRTESYGWGYLGHWQEQQQHWPEAEAWTQRALTIAQDLQNDELRYQWQWQLGRIAVAQGERQLAIARYSAAVNTLQNLRRELIAISQDIQFSFQKQIEPIYRGLISLLLSPESLAKEPELVLEQARQVLGELQLVELNNFFRAACIEAVPRSLDAVDESAAVLYPIILPEKFAVILSLPGQPLSVQTIAVSQAEVEASIQQMLSSMRVTSFPGERFTTAQQLYQWLIAPVEPILKASEIKTLVFVLDGALRNIPLAALQSENHYLIEDYQLALSPGLTLMQVDDEPQQRSKPNALLAGLSLGNENRPPLVGVEQEINYLETLLDARTLLDEAFTKAALIEQSQNESFNVVHLATHAQFGSTDEETFIETWDGKLRINQLRQLLIQQDIQGLPTDLLVLSACDTAQGNDQALLGMAGMAVRAGAQSTLATLWSVNDQATTEFIQYFYSGLLVQNLTKAAAVQYAQQQLIKNQKFQHPYYWAPFILLGDWT